MPPAPAPRRTDLMQAVLDDYTIWRNDDLGADAEFLKVKHPEIPISTFRVWLMRWRERTAKGLHPITLTVSPNAATIAAILARVSVQDKAKAKGESFQKETLRTDEIEGLSVDGPLMSMLPKAIAIYERSLEGKAISVGTLKTATALLEAAGHLGKNKQPEKISAFVKWSTNNLKSLMAELVPDVMTTRVNIEQAPTFSGPEPDQVADPARTDNLPGSIPIDALPSSTADTETTSPSGSTS